MQSSPPTGFGFIPNFSTPQRDMAPPEQWAMGPSGTDGGSLGLMLVGLERGPGLPCLEKETTTVGEMQGQGGDDAQDNSLGNHRAIR